MKTYKLQVWQSGFYGITIILTNSKTGSGRRIFGQKLWAGQDPAPRLLKEFETTKAKLIMDIRSI